MPGTPPGASQPVADNHPVIQQMKKDLGEFAAKKFVNAAQESAMPLTALGGRAGDPPKVISLIMAWKTDGQKLRLSRD